MQHADGTWMNHLLKEMEKLLLKFQPIWAMDVISIKDISPKRSFKVSKIWNKTSKMHVNGTLMKHQ